METSLSVNVFEWLDDAILESLEYLDQFGEDVDAGTWQGVPTEGKPDLVTKEIINLQWTAKMPESQEEAAELINPNLPWAEDHFQERVAGVPSNPGVEYKNWPWWNDQTEETMIDGRFTHTYQERFWPVHAGIGSMPLEPQMLVNTGIRFMYGDLTDVISLLAENPLTRQATFPIFFPEDTGAKHGGRIPCTLHYHFLMRQNKLHLWYPIRSCDAIRHFRDDVYMAVRLAQWVLNELYVRSEAWRPVEVGYLNFTAYSFHLHKGDLRERDQST
jgi:hypothetical protein